MVNNLLVCFYFSNFWVFHSALLRNATLYDWSSVLRQIWGWDWQKAPLSGWLHLGRTFSWFLDFWRAIYIPQDLGDKDQAGDQFRCCRSGLEFPTNQLLYSFRLSYPRLIQSFTLHMFISFPGQMKIEDSCLTCDKISNALFCIYSLHSIQVICQASFITTDLLNTIQ